MRFSAGNRQTLAACASTVYERHEAASEAPPDAHAANESSAPALRPWQQAFAPNDPTSFLRRLTWDGLDLPAAIRATSISPAGMPPVPDTWTGWLDRMCDEAPGVLADIRAGSFRASSAPHRDDARPFEEIWAVVLRAGRRLVNDRSATSSTHIDATILDTFERQLALEVGRYGDLALFEYFREPAGDATMSAPTGPGTRARYDAFVTQVLDGGLLHFFATYAVLARQLATVLASWVDTTTEFFARLEADRSALATTFAGGIDPGEVTDVAPALSDPHHGRRRVCAVTFASGLRVIYKPRSVRIELVFGGLLRWLNPGLEHPLRTLVVLDRGTHGWVEFATHERLSNASDVAPWFQRAGALMCATAVLGARDLHRDNLVATRGGPVLVDLELLLQPDAAPGGASDDAGASPHRYESTPGAASGDATKMSCLSTGMLSLIDLTPDGEPHDAGGLRGALTGALPFATRVWRDCGTDTLHFVEQSTFTTAHNHQVLLDAVVQRPDEHAGDIVSGFTQAYHTLLSRRDDLLAPDGPLAAFGQCALRVLPRPTNQYAMLAFLLATPRYQRDGIAPGCAIDVLHRGFARAATRPALWPMAVEERRAMLALDIPYFSVRADGTDAYAGGHLVVAGYFTRSGLQAAVGRVRALSATDLQAQAALLQRALSESTESRYAIPAGMDSVAGAERDGASSCGSGGPFIDAAEWVANALLARAELSADALVWPYRLPSGGPGWRDHHLYDGSLGIGVFLSALAATTGKSHWAGAARAALAPVRAHAARHPLHTLPVDEPLGGGNGLGSVVYGLALVAAFDDDPLWLELARGLAAAIPARLATNGPVDVVNGSAGALHALLALHEVTGDPQVLAAARACGEHLLHREVETGRGDTVWPSADGTRLLGFAHGTAGVASALARLASAAGDRMFARSARRAYRFVRRHHLRASGHWSIAVASDDSPAGGIMTGWCHGAPGIVVSALYAAAGRPSPAILHGIESAMRTVVQWQPSQADHVCCGALGRAEVLLLAGEQLGRRDAVDAARVLAQRVIDRARRRGHFRLSGAGTDYRVFDPGFFQGLSGIGYTLLRMAQGAALPSVVAFGAPQSSLRYCSPVAGGRGAGHTTAALAAGAVGTEFTS